MLKLFFVIADPKMKAYWKQVENVQYPLASNPATCPFYKMSLPRLKITKSFKSMQIKAEFIFDDLIR